MAEEKTNTPQAEGNSVPNPSTQADDKMMCLIQGFKR